MWTLVSFYVIGVVLFNVVLRIMLYFEPFIEALLTTIEEGISYAEIEQVALRITLRAGIDG